MKKQSTIGRLFPTFPARVRKVADNGGVTLVQKMPNTWHFSVTSGTKEGVKYDVYMSFINLEEMINKFVPDRNLWNKNKTNIDYRKLSQEVMNSVDIETSCSCPATLFWGQDFIRTGVKAQFGRQEYRPPDIRNPKRYGSLCKHGELVFEVLPMYVATFASFLKMFWYKEVQKAIKATIMGVPEELKAAALTKEEMEKEKEQMGKKPSRGRGGRKEEEEQLTGEEEVPYASPAGPDEEEETVEVEPVSSEDLGGEEEKPSTKTGKPSTKFGGKTGTKTSQTSTRSGTKTSTGSQKSPTRPGTKRGVK